MSDPINGWAYKVLAKTDVSLKQAAWAFGCAKKGSEDERLLLVRLWEVIARSAPPAPAPAAGREGEPATPEKP